MAADRDESSSTSKIGVDDQQRSMMPQQLQDQFREIERVNSKIQALISKLHTLCSNLGMIRASSKQSRTTTTTLESGTVSTIVNLNNPTERPYVVGHNERVYLEQLASHLEQTRCDWEDGLDFVKDCLALRNNDPNMTSLALYHNTATLTPPCPYRVVLGDCMHGNSTITNLSLHMGTWNEVDGDDVFTAVGHMEPILEYMDSSTTLQRVSLCGDPAPKAKIRADMCLLAISRNPNRNITHLELDFPTEGLAKFLSTSTSIQSLNLHNTDGSSYDFVDRMRLGAAFANNCSVTSLTLRAKELDNDEGSNLIDAILYGADYNFNQSLEKLTLQYDHESNPDMRCAKYFLQYTTTLQELKLISCVFDYYNMNRLLEGLRQHYMEPARRSSLKKLTLTNCTYDDNAERLLLSFMQSTELYTNHTDDSAMLEELRIDFLYIEEVDAEDDDTRELPFGDLPYGVAMASMILPLSVSTDHGTVEIRPTVGSQLRVLSLEPFSSMAGFCDHLLSNVALVQVPELHLAQVGNKEWLQLAKLIPNLKTLRELRLFLNNDVTANDILSVIRETDHHLNALSVYDDNCNELFNDSQSRLVHAWCQRNAGLGSMLSRKLHHWKFEGLHWTGRNTHKRQKKMHEDPNDNDNVVIFPRLLQAAKQVRSTRVSTILSALLIFEVDCSGNDC